VTTTAEASNGGRRHESGEGHDEGMRHQPALEPAGDGSAPAAGDAVREAMCRMSDGTWQLVRVAAWQQAGPGRWRCLLRWGEWGTVREGWYIHDPAILVPAGGST
jgi:hypothetical protein